MNKGKLREILKHTEAIEGLTSNHKIRLHLQVIKALVKELIENA